ncbi:unnamed protein product [Brachionus calyciflorus]|uniref:Rel homology dimerisation domain-containing protein n=1 Tax=Brachionus calyciflorus TaxID=104777 RepID=A0A813M074_9BILA|nr:unnamed protein product [Brachionus calyciflorus]
MSKKNERVLCPNLKIIKQPKTNIKYLKAYSYVDQEEIFDHSNVSFECRVENFDLELPDRELYLMVSISNTLENLSHLPNPNFLFCKNRSVRLLTHFLKPELDFYLFPIKKDDLKCSITDLRIVNKSHHQLMNIYENLVLTSLRDTYLNEIDNFDYLTQLEKLSEIVKEKVTYYENLLSSQIDKCRLKLQVLIYNKKEKKLENYLTESIYTDTIHDRYPINPKIKSDFNNLNTDTSITNLNNLRIIKSSRNTGSIKGGDEMMLLTTFFKEKDIEVEFFQINNTAEIGWRSFAKINRAQTHANCALVIQVPEFNGKIEKLEPKKDYYERIKVNYRLFRPSTKQYSENYTFYYVKDDAYDLKTILTKDLIEKKNNYLKNFEKKNSNLKRKQDEKIDSEIEMIVEEKKIKTFDNSPKENLENSETKVDTPSTTPTSPIQNLDLNKNQIGQEETKIQNPIVLKANLDNCISKMNALADRTGKALIKFAKTRSFVELLKTQRFLINAQDEDGNTPIHLSILNGNFDLLEIFIDVTLTIPYQNIINIRNYKSLTPLLIACYMGEIEACEFLLNANADLSLADYDGNNPIHIACMTKNLDLLKILIKYTDKQCNFGILNSINHEGYSPLHICVLKESYEMVRELLYCKDLRINIPDKRCGFTALHHAASNFNLYKIVDILIRNEKIDLNCKTYTGCTPLHLAVANKNYLNAIMLIRNGADTNIQNDFPIHFDYELVSMGFNKQMKLIEDDLKKKNLKLIVNKLAESKDKKRDYNEEVVKLSEEVRRVFSPEIDVTIEDENKTKTTTHNYDVFTYSLNDPWIQEILKNPNDIPKELIIKIACFEKLRKQLYNDHVLKKDQAEALMKTTLDVVKPSQMNNLQGNEKISQQESEESYREKKIISNQNDTSRMEIST